jgi:restriction endonuclease S subunit
MTVAVPLVELGRVMRSRAETPSLEELLSGQIPIVAKVRFADGSIELRLTSDSRTELILVRRGDLLVSGINALKGAVGLLPKEASTDIAATIHYSAYEIDESNILPRYLHEYLRSPAFRRRAISQLPNGIKTELKSRRLLGIAVPIPPKQEQERRLRTLDERRCLVSALNERRRKSSQMVLGRRVTVGVDARLCLAARLRDMQDDITSRCRLGILEEVLIEGLRHGPSFPCAQDSDGVPVLMPSSTTGFGLDTTKVSFAVGSPELRDLDYLDHGDIIFARGNKPDQVGNCGLFEGEIGVMSYANLFMRIRVKASAVDPWFAQYWLMSPIVRDHVRRHTKGTGPSIQKINGRGVRSIPFPLAVPFATQRWWIGQLHTTRLLTARLEELMEKQCKDLRIVQQKIVDETFSGL